MITMNIDMYTPGAIASSLSKDKQETSQSAKKLAGLFGKQITTKRPASIALETPSEDRQTEPKKKKKKKKTEDPNKEEKSPSSTDKEKKKQVKDKRTGRSSVWRSISTKSTKEEDPEETKPDRPADPEKEERTIFVGNISTEVTKKILVKLFKNYGTIESIRFRSAAPSDPKLPKKAVIIKKEFHPNKNTLNAYVVFSDKKAAHKSLVVNGQEFKGLHLRVDQSKLRQEKAKHDHDKSVFLGNLPLDVQEEDIRAHFEPCGDIDNVRAVRDGSTGLGKGFGFVLFKDSSSVSLALKLHEEDFKGRKLRVTRSTPDSKKHSKKVDRSRLKGKLAKRRPQVKRELKRDNKEGKVKKDKKFRENKEAFKAHKLKNKKKQKLRLKTKQKRNVANILIGKGEKIKKREKTV